MFVTEIQLGQHRAKMEMLLVLWKDFERNHMVHIHSNEPNAALNIF